MIKKFIIFFIFLPACAGSITANVYHDPTTPITPDTPTTFISDEDLILQAIFFSSVHPYAIINNVPIEINQTINGYQLISISKENVQLKKDNGIVTLSLLPQAIKK